MNALVKEAQIILVDDNEFHLQLISHQLAMMSCFNVSTCSCAHHALKEISEIVTDNLLVILDLGMPDMDGVEFFQALATMNFDGTLLILSGQEEKIIKSAVNFAEGLGLNVLGQLQKPAQQSELKKLANRWIPASRIIMSGEQPPAYSIERLQQAIMLNELFLVYQPKVYLQTGELASVEALVRWSHPQDGIVLPKYFVPLAEENGLSDDLAQLVLRQALRQLKEWEKVGLSLSVAMNISISNLTSSCFIGFVENELSAAGVDPDRLVLEVTGSCLIKNTSASRSGAAHLGLRDIGLSISAIGTAESSSRQLQDISFDELKIDHKLLQQAASNQEFDDNLQLARKLSVSTSIERLEDEKAWGLSKESGCDYGQGYFIAKPMAANCIPQWKDNWKQRYAALA